MKIEKISDSESTTVVADPTSKEALIVDPSSSLIQVQEFLQKRGWKPVAILLTEGDLAHASRAAELKFYFNIPLVAHEKQLLLLQHLPSQAEKAGLCGVKVPFVDRLVRQNCEMKFGSITVKIVEKGADGTLSFLME